MAKTSPQMPARLAESAFNLFSRHGIQKVSLDQIAAETGVTKGSLYWHFKSKDELIKAACSHYYQNYHRRMQAAIAPIQNPIERLKAALHLSVRICLLDAGNRVFTMDIWALAVKDAEIRRGWLQFYDSVREFFLGMVRAAVHAGDLQTNDPENAVNLMLEAIEGIKMRALFEPHICCPEEESVIFEGLIEILNTKRKNNKAA